MDPRPCRHRTWIARHFGPEPRTDALCERGFTVAARGSARWREEAQAARRRGEVEGVVRALPQGELARGASAHHTFPVPVATDRCLRVHRLAPCDVVQGSSFHEAASRTVPRSQALDEEACQVPERGGVTR